MSLLPDKDKFFLSNLKVLNFVGFFKGIVELAITDDHLIYVFELK